MSLIREADCLDGYRWYCNGKIVVRKQKAYKCGVRVEFRAKTFFTGSNLNIFKILRFVNLTVFNIQSIVIAHQLSISRLVFLERSAIRRVYFKGRKVRRRGKNQAFEVNPSLHFKDPGTGAHTNLIENSWRHAKAV